ncbi:MAG: RecX family transcriptional regulator [Anaerolineales bacterium]|nr:RecX family transcriptional regulator [Anaerolineales bacterium]
MATITAIKQQKHNPQRVSVYLDGEYAFPLAKIVAAWLKVGQQLDTQKIHALQNEDEAEKAFQRALRFISYRPRSQAEVQRKLAEHRVPAELAANIIARLQEGGLLDDADFAQRWAADRAELHPRGARLIRMELRQKGIAEEHIAPALDGLDEAGLARAAASRKARQLARLDWPEFRTKLFAHLGRRGFDYETAAEACQAAWQELQETTN